MDKDAMEFLKGLEEKRGGKLTWRTYSTFYANSNGIVREHGVFLYEINNHFWYEDFEQVSRILGIPIAKPKNAEPYVKFEAHFGPEEVKSIRLVKKSRALAFCKGKIKREQVKAAKVLEKFFCSCVTELALKDDTVLYFELIDKTLSNKIESIRS